jgi:hypothetical protein
MKSFRAAEREKPNHDLTRSLAREPEECKQILSESFKTGSYKNAICGLK